MNVEPAARLAKAAYLPWKQCEAVTQAEGFTRFTSYDIAGTQAFVAANKKQIVYVFAGTNERTDILDDLKFRMVQVGQTNRKIHRGFAAATTDAAGEIREGIVNWLNDDPFGMEITGIGHSLGAAVCALFSASFVSKLKPSLWLFGCPRIGNRRFKNWFNFNCDGLGSRTWRVVNNNDAVTRVPPRLFGYRHIGRELYLDWLGNRYVEPGFWRRAWNQVVGRGLSWWRGDKVDGVTDHFMDSYLEALGK